MNKAELVEQLQSVSGWSRADQEKLSRLRYWGALKGAAQNLGEVDLEKGARAEFPAEMEHFCWALARFIEANIEGYTMPKTTLTGVENVE
jgi:hypothetical protein